MKRLSFLYFLTIILLFTSNKNFCQYIINGDTMICFNKAESKKIALMLENREYLYKENQLLKEEIKIDENLFKLCETNLENAKNVIAEMNNKIEKNEKKIIRKNKIIKSLILTNLVSLSILTATLLIIL